MANKLSYREVESLVETALNSAEKYRYWIRDLYPGEVVYQDNTTNVLLRNSYDIDKENKITFGADPQKVIQKKSYETVKFSASGLHVVTFSGSDVLMEGKIFEVGEYPDRDFSLDEGEADDAIAAFTPVPSNIEHVKSHFSGKVGTLERVWRTGKDIYGKFRIPKVVHQLFGEATPTVSLEWLREPTKRIKAFAWAVDPYITDAALTAAFSNKRRTTVMQYTLADLLRMAEAKGLDTETIDVSALFTNTPPTTPPTTPIPPTTPPPTADFTNHPQWLQMQKQLAEGRNREARQLVYGWVNEGQIDPNGKELLVAYFTQVIEDDASNVVTFSYDKDKKGNRLEALTAYFNSLPKDPARRTKKVLASAIFSSTSPENLLGDEDPDEVVETPPSKDKQEELLNLSGLGREAITHRNGSSH